MRWRMAHINHVKGTIPVKLEASAWGSSVWIENEPNNIVHFERMRATE